MKTYSQLAIPTADALIFGTATKPLTTRRGLVLGGGAVYPELNFTLPSMSVEAATMPAVLEQYRMIIDGALKRAVELETPGVVVEFETLPPMTIEPSWAVQITKLLNDAMEDAYAQHGLKSVLRITPTDVREFSKPPQIRSGQYWDAVIRTFDGCAGAGAELLSIESVGGKEVHDDALISGDLPAVLFGLCTMGVRDMRYLWTAIDGVAKHHGVHAAGDTACGFGNTAMVLAEHKMISRTFAAIVRAITAVRSLVAYECGAVGPGKDCGYENAILKAITGYPMAMEGRCAACAHLSPVGNVAACACDTWSNESVQNIKLLGGMAPTISMEQLVYDCRVMNLAIEDGPDKARMLRDWFARSDACLDPQAYILTPDATVRIAQAIVSASDHYHAGRAAATTALALIREGVEQRRLKLSERELPWLDLLGNALEDLPATEAELIAQQTAVVDTAKVPLREYELA